jgi:hypothetical protein
MPGLTAQDVSCDLLIGESDLVHGMAYPVRGVEPADPGIILPLPAGCINRVLPGVFSAPAMPCCEIIRVKTDDMIFTLRRAF